MPSPPFPSSVLVPSVPTLQPFTTLPLPPSRIPCEGKLITVNCATVVGTSLRIPISSPASDEPSSVELWPAMMTGPPGYTIFGRAVAGVIV